MSTPTTGVLGSSLRRAADWRYLLLFVVAMLLSTLLLLSPVLSFLGSLFDLSPHAADLVGKLTSGPFTEIVRQMGEQPAAAIGPGFRGALLVAALFAPALAGATVALAWTRRTADFRTLLGAIGELYPRMVRVAVVSLLPLGIAGALIAAMMHFGGDARDRAVLASTASHITALTTSIAVLLVWLANVSVDAGRAHFAAEPERRSAFLAWWSGLKLLARRPLAVLGMSLGTTLLGVGLAAIVTAIRLHLPLAGSVSIAGSFVLAQLALVPLAWGRAGRVVGLTEVIRRENA